LRGAKPGIGAGRHHLSPAKDREISSFMISLVPP
jgi:hypothetical protein